MVRLWSSTSSLSCGWYAVVVISFAQSKEKTIVKNLLYNSFLFTNIVKQLSWHIFGIGIKLTWAVDITCVSFEYWSAILKTCWFTVSVLRSAHKMSIATNSRVTADGKSWSFVCASLDIHSCHISNIREERCTHHVSCAANKSVVELWHTYLSPLHVLQMWNCGTNIRLGYVIWWERLFERFHLLVLFLYGFQYDHKGARCKVSNYRRDCLTFADCRLFFKKIFGSRSYSRCSMGKNSLYDCRLFRWIFRGSLTVTSKFSNTQ